MMNEKPRIQTMAKNLAVEAAKHVASGCKTRPLDEIDRIRRICELCDHVCYEGLAMRCCKCGCKMNIKITWATTKCPTGKW
jgi:hypothetical protein